MWSWNETTIHLRLEPLEEGGFVATSPDVPGLVAQGRTRMEAAQIAQGLARTIAEVCLEHGDPLPPALKALADDQPVDLTLPVGTT